jgi:hypothetical protein
MRVISTSINRPGRGRGGVGTGGSWGGRTGGRLAFLVMTCSACGLDFDVSGRQFDCPTAMVNCLACNADGTCRLPQHIDPAQPTPSPAEPPPSGEPLPDGGMPNDPDAAASPPVPGPDAATVPPQGPTVPAECAAFQSRASDSLCLGDEQKCFTLGNVLSPALTLWLDPTTLPSGESRYWCDRSGRGHHAQLLPEGEGVLVGADERAASEALARSVTLDGGWLALDAGSEPVLRPGNFAVLMAAATPLEPSDSAAFELFSSGDQSRIDLTIAPATGIASGKISSTQTVLVTQPVVTRSKVFDGGFHLFTLYRRSEVQVLDDVLQLRLNGVLEFRGSSIAIPRALDLSAARNPIIGGGGASGAATGRGKVAVVIALRGSVPEDELARLENFLCDALAVCAPPGPPLGTPPDAGP